MVSEREDAPYVGPRPYGEADRSLFFARDAEIEELISLVIAHRCVLLYAISGAGKSSLLRAGLSAPLGDRGFQVLGPVRFQAPEAPPADAPNVYSYAALGALAAAGKGDAAQPLLDPAAELKHALATLPRPTRRLWLRQSARVGLRPVRGDLHRLSGALAASGGPPAPARGRPR